MNQMSIEIKSWLIHDNTTTLDEVPNPNSESLSSLHSVWMQKYTRCDEHARESSPFGCLSDQLIYETFHVCTTFTNGIQYPPSLSHQFFADRDSGHSAYSGRTRGNDPFGGSGSVTSMLYIPAQVVG